jgi:hypothetical protein
MSSDAEPVDDLAHVVVSTVARKRGRSAKSAPDRRRQEDAAKNYLVTFRPDTSEEEFRRQVTQSKRVDHFESPLARALLQRSADNFCLALEVYNRPTLANRLDAFALLFTTAWEQLLKAELVEAHGEDSIFKPIKPNHRRESIALQACLERLFPNDADPIRRSVEMIAELRHER